MTLPTKLLLAATMLLASAGRALADAPLLPPLVTVGGTLDAAWRLAGLPRQKLPFTRYSVVELDGRRALRVEADGSYGNLVHALRVDAAALTLSWSWRVDEFVAASDLSTKRGDDAAAKVCVFFEMPMSQVPFVERQLLRMARAASDEPLPAATVCYVWDRTLPVGTTLNNAYTHRVRYLVLRSAAANPARWTAERRDVAADFVKLFGNESTQVPPIVGIAVGADADNTHGHSVAHVADLVLAP